MHLIIHIWYLEPYLFFCQNVYFVCTTVFHNWHPVEDFFNVFNVFNTCILLFE